MSFCTRPSHISTNKKCMPCKSPPKPIQSFMIHLHFSTRRGNKSEKTFTYQHSMRVLYSHFHSLLKSQEIDSPKRQRPKKKVQRPTTSTHLKPPSLMLPRSMIRPVPMRHGRHRRGIARRAHKHALRVVRNPGHIPTIHAAGTRRPSRKIIVAGIQQVRRAQARNPVPIPVLVPIPPPAQTKA